MASRLEAGLAVVVRGLAGLLVDFLLSGGFLVDFLALPVVL